MTSITVYSSDNCGVCTELVPKIKSRARQKGIPVNVVDVDSCGQPCEHIRFVPYFTVDGRQVSASQIEKMLK